MKVKRVYKEGHHEIPHRKRLDMAGESMNSKNFTVNVERFQSMLKEERINEVHISGDLRLGFSHLQNISGE